MGARRVLAYAAVLLVLVGCSIGEALADYGDPVNITAEELVGDWHGGTQRLLTFAADGTFIAKNLPLEAFQDPVPSWARSTPAGAGLGTAPGTGPPSVVPSDLVSVAPRGVTASAAPLDGEGTWTISGSSVGLSFGASRLRGRELAALLQNDVVYLVFFYVGAGGNSWTGYHR